MANITQAQAQANLDALMVAQAAFNGKASVSVSTSAGTRNQAYTSLKELTAAITYWSRMLSELQRRADGKNRLGYSRVDFRAG